MRGVKVSSRIVALHPRNVFRISRGARRAAGNVFLKIEREGITGYGEASANAYYGESAEGVMEKLGTVAGFLAGRRVVSTADIAAIWSEAWPLLAPSRAAQCALDIALWDWLGKKEGCSVGELASSQVPSAIGSFVTIGISEPAELDAKVAELAGFPRVKIKSGHNGDISAAELLRAALPNACMAVDANCAWEGLNLAKMGDALRSLHMEFVEQPLPPGSDRKMPISSRELDLPVMADESCVTMEDVARMPGLFSEINIKLVKCGGLTPALKMAVRGRELGLGIMVGCMLESSILIAAGAVAAQLADYADLDGAWLLSDDPASGWHFEQGTLHPPKGAGLGVTLPPEFFES